MTNFDGVGRFIYGSHRHGGDEVNVVNWMADELGVKRPSVLDEAAKYGLYEAFSAKFFRADELADSFTRFMATFGAPDAGSAR